MNAPTIDHACTYGNLPLFAPLRTGQLRERQLQRVRPLATMPLRLESDVQLMGQGEAW
jgi:hypothetical protein